MRRQRTALLACFGVWGIAACSQVPAYTRPAAPLPDRFVENETAARSAAGPEAGFWERFESPELLALMQEALQVNHDLQAAAERVVQAQASLGRAHSELLPTVGASVGGTGTATRQLSGDRLRTAYTDSVQMTASYEVDLFKANRAGQMSAEATLASTEYARQVVALSLQASVASAYLQALAIQDRLKIAESNLAAAEELLRLVEVRLENGAGTALELVQQRTAVLTIRSTLPGLRQSLAETLHGLSILVGRSPVGFTIAGDGLASLQVPGVGAGLPVALLERRPDLKQAEYALIAAHADVGAARAALYPSLTLTASAGADGVLSGGTSLFAQLVGSLTQTLFDSGRRQAQVDLSEAACRELAETYLQAVLTALQEVQDSLVATTTNTETVELLADTAAQARESLRLSRLRYEQGADDLLAVLDSQTSLLSAEDGLVQAELARFLTAVNLFKALGGGGPKAATSPQESL